MALDVHTVSVMNGSAALSNPDRIKFGIATIAVPAPPGNGEMTAGVVDNAGSGYTSIPSASAAGGTGGTLTPSMQIATSVAAAAGSTYAPGDTVTLTGGTASQQAILEVQTTKTVTAPAVAAGGAGYAVGDQITSQNGLVLQVATLSTTAVATVTIVNGGSFSANNVAAGGLTQVSTTGTGTGATFTMTAAKYGVNTYVEQNAGSYSALPSSPISQGSTSGSGSGFTLTASTWSLASLAASGGSGYANGAAVTFTGGAGTGAAAHVEVEPIGANISIPVTNWPDLPPAYIVQVEPNGPCNSWVANKTTSGFTIELSPLSTSVPVGATSVDVVVLA